MKTTITTAILTAALSGTLFAQDIITLKNGTELKVKVLEVEPTEIKYKKFDNLEGPTYSDLKSNVFMIKYESGLKDVFSDQLKSTQTAETNSSETPDKEIHNLKYSNTTLNNDLIITRDGDSIKCIIDLVTDRNISYRILKQGADTKTSIALSSVSKYFNNGAPPAVETSTAKAASAQDDDDDFLPEIRRYGGPRVGATYVFDGAYKNALEEEGKRNIYSQFGWQFEKRLFTTKTGISAVVEFIPMIGGIDMGKFIPSASALLGIRVKNGIEFGVGPNAAIYGGRDLRGEFHTSGNVGIVIAAGFSLKSDKVYFPINLAFIPSVGKKSSYYDPSTGQSVSKKYETGAKLSLLVGFNYRKH